VFGENGGKAIRLNHHSLALEVVAADAGGVLAHDETNPVIAQLLAAMGGPDFPVAIGVLYRKPKPSFDEAFARRRGKSAEGNLAALLLSGNTWVVT